METKSPSYYRDLLESLLVEKHAADWTKLVSGISGDDILTDTILEISDLSIPINISTGEVTVRYLEIPIVYDWEGTIGIYFNETDSTMIDEMTDKDVDTILAAMSQGLGKLFGRAVPVTRDPDLWEPLNGNDIGLRLRLQPQVISGLKMDWLAAMRDDPEIKKPVIRSLLLMLKNNQWATAEDWIQQLKDAGMKWPEFAPMLKSIGAMAANK